VSPPVPSSTSFWQSGWFGLAFLLIALLVAWWARRLERRDRAMQEALRIASLDAKLSSLQAQLPPHFLLNVLNSLLPLIEGDPARARRMILRLGDLLRDTLFAQTPSLVTVDRDLALLEKYLDIERMRFGDRMRVEIEVDPRAVTAMVPTFVLQLLVENALKHAMDLHTGRVRVRVRAAVEKDGLSLTVRDDGPGLSEEVGGIERGIGLRNIQRRLEALFPGDHVLRLRNTEEGGCEALVRIPFSPAGSDTNGRPTDAARSGGAASRA
jgi:LytS/YehU family sensor histidine kinase